MFDGTVIWTYKDDDDIFENDQIKLIGSYALGKLDGNFTAYDEKGNVTDRFGFNEGKRYSNTQDASKIYKPFIGYWEGEIQKETFSGKAQVYDLKRDGSMEFYRNNYYKTDLDSDWLLDDDTTYQTIGTGTWTYQPKTNNSGILTFGYRGKEATKAEVSIINDNQIILKETWVSDIFSKEDIGKEIMFTREK